MMMTTQVLYSLGLPGQGTIGTVLRLARCPHHQRAPSLLATSYLLSAPLLVMMNLKSLPKKRTPEANRRMQCRTLAVRPDDLQSLVVTNTTLFRFRHKHTQRSSVRLVTYMLPPQFTMSGSMISACPRVRY